MHNGPNGLKCQKAHLAALPKSLQSVTLNICVSEAFQTMFTLRLDEFFAALGNVRVPNIARETIFAMTNFYNHGRQVGGHAFLEKIGGNS